ncbi:MAG: inositol monophosphatase [Anaerolineales bacterium]|nr:inositol monophosphatase [Anaerolineales bacterium]
MQADHLLETATRAARQAGAIALAGLGQPGRLRWKGSRDVTMPATFQAQEHILSTIRQAFPDHALLSEELAEQPDPAARALWIIDPIDGSLNYMKGIPVFSIAIGFREDGIYRLGVVYDPARDELFHARYHRGAFLNGRRLHTRSVSEGIEAYQNAAVATDWPAQIERRAATALVIRMVAGEVISTSILGSPALALCYIAAGRLDAYFHLQLQPWDVAAAAVILQEGGGVLTDDYGGTWFHSAGGYVATNGVIHGSMLHPLRIVRDQEALLKRSQPPASSTSGP